MKKIFILTIMVFLIIALAGCGGETGNKVDTVQDQPMVESTRQNIEYAEMLKAMAHPTRLCIIKNLINKGGCTVSYMQTCTGQPQSTLSQHISKLRALKIISGTRNGKEINYEVSNDLVKSIISILYK